MATKMQRMTEHDIERLHIRAVLHGDDAVKEITALLDLAEAIEAGGGDTALETYRASFVRAPKRDEKEKP